MQALVQILRAWLKNVIYQAAQMGDIFKSPPQLTPSQGGA